MLPDIVHRVCDVHEMLEELAGHIFVRLIFFRQFQRHRQHVQAIHPHPACSVRLLQVSARRQRCRAIEYSDIVQPQESSLEYVPPIGIFAIHPPREIQQ